VASPPTGWSAERLHDYVVWAHDVVRSCRGLNPRLEAAFDAAHEEASRRFG
jgi:guanosine-3',5'-bis(diphosphate) 3'-pyrophosphohydrolase